MESVEGRDQNLVTPYETVADDSFAPFSNFGPVVKMAAPGVNILSTINGAGYAMDSGTSMAAPYVTGYAAIYKSQHPSSTPAEVISDVLGQGSKPDSVCDGASHGYFSGDVDTIGEPLLYNQIAFTR